MAELTYTKVGDYLVPDLVMDGEDELEEMPLGKYGMLREDFLREHHSGTYTSMLLTGCQRQSEIVRKRRRNFVIFGREGNKLKRFLAQKVCLQSAASGA